MRPIFDRAVELILFLEDRSGRGVVTETAGDRGGLTKWGISSRAHPDVDVRNLTRSAAIAIYRERYWKACRCGELAPELAILVFDAAVNQGVNAAARMLQRAAGVTADGNIGPVTIAAAARGGRELVLKFSAKRASRYADAPAADRERFSDGWFRRLFEVFLEATGESRR